MTTTDQVRPPEGLSPDALKEWHYVMRERLGHSCEDRKPTALDYERAKAAADKAVEDFR
jgi:hypothetical protein